MSALVVLTVVLALAFLAAVGAAVVAWNRHVDYKARHPFTQQDLDKARKDSVKQSHYTVRGKVGEHFAPFFPEFLDQFTPSDARFFGSPVDYVVFDGLASGAVNEVVFVEVKTGKAGLTPEERLVREAVQEGRVTWQTLRLPNVVESD